MYPPLFRLISLITSFVAEGFSGARQDKTSRFLWRALAHWHRSAHQANCYRKESAFQKSAERRESICETSVPGLLNHLGRTEGAVQLLFVELISSRRNTLWKFIVTWTSPPFSKQKFPIKKHFGMSSSWLFLYKGYAISNQVPLLD